MTCRGELLFVLIFLGINLLFFAFPDPTPRWPPSRDSPEFRPYNSLPRGQDVSEYPSLKRTSTPNKSPEPPPEVQNKPESPKTITTDETDQVSTKEEKEENGTYVRQRRISLFERTLSELYDKDGKRSKRSSIDKSDQKKTDDNGDKNKNQDVKPSKIPSPRKKMHTARSDSAAVVTKKEPIKKFSSLQNNKKSNSIEKQCEKHVSFEHVEADVAVKSFKSGIPRRDSKGSINDGKKLEDSPNGKIQEESSVSNEETDSLSSDVYFAQVDTIVEEPDNTEVEQLSDAVFKKVTVKKRRQDFKKSQAFDEGRLKVCLITFLTTNKCF